MWLVNLIRSSVSLRTGRATTAVMLLIPPWLSRNWTGARKKPGQKVYVKPLAGIRRTANGFPELAAAPIDNTTSNNTGRRSRQVENIGDRRGRNGGPGLESILQIGW